MNRFAFNPEDELQKLGFRLRPFHSWSLEKALGFLADTGYHSVEFDLDHPELTPQKITAARLSKLRSTLDKVGLKVSAVSYTCNANGDKPLEDILEKTLGIALDLNAAVLILCAGAQCDDQGGKKTLNALTTLLNTAEEKEVAIAIEPEPDSLFHGLYEFAELARRLTGSPLRLNLNVAHAAITEGNLSEVIEIWSSYIVHVHLSDVRNQKHAHLLPGDGYLDLRQVVKLLRGYHYDGDWTLDLTGNPASPDRLAHQAMQKCRELFS